MKGDRMHANSVQKILREDLNVKLHTPQKSCKNIRKTVTSHVREELGVAVAAKVAGHKSQNTTDRHYSYATRTTGSYSEEYTEVISCRCHYNAIFAHEIVSPTRWIFASSKPFYFFPAN